MFFLLVSSAFQWSFQLDVVCREAFFWIPLETNVFLPFVHPLSASLSVLSTLLGLQSDLPCLSLAFSPLSGRGLLKGGQQLCLSPSTEPAAEDSGSWLVHSSNVDMDSWWLGRDLMGAVLGALPSSWAPSKDEIVSLSNTKNSQAPQKTS